MGTRSTVNKGNGANIIVVSVLDGRVEGSLGKLLLHYALEKRGDENRLVGATGVTGREEAPRGFRSGKGLCHGSLQRLLWRRGRKDPVGRGREKVLRNGFRRRRCGDAR